MYRETVKIETQSGISAPFTGFLRGVGIAVVFTLVVFSVFACLLAYTKLPESTVPVIALATETLSALIAGYSTSQKAGSRGFLLGLLAGLGYLLLLWITASLAGDGFYVGTHFFTMLLLSAVGGAVGGVLGVNLKSGRSNKHRR